MDKCLIKVAPASAWVLVNLTFGAVALNLATLNVPDIKEPAPIVVFAPILYSENTLWLLITLPSVKLYPFR